MTIPLTDPLNALSRCPQCSTAKPTLHLRGVIPTGRNNLSWAIFQCSSCDEIACFKGQFNMGDGYRTATEVFQQAVQYGELMMPAPSDDFTDWPERARRYMAQAVEALAAPDGAVMLTGSAVDAMLKEKGLTKGSVYERIEEAVATNLLTPAMAEWAHTVRLSANSPRHADLDDPHATLDEARAVIEFATALGQFLFVLPTRIQRGKEAAAQATKDAQAEA